MILRHFLNRFATPLTTGLFAVSTVSGVALFFHWQSPAFHSMHEWLSMVFLLPFALHLWKNWRPLVAYARRYALWLILAASALAATPFALDGLSGPRGGGNPGFRAVGLMTQARLADLAPILKTSPDSLVGALQKRGYKVASADDTVAGVARASGAPANEVLFAVLPERSGQRGGGGASGAGR
jgi:hypothetical protein